MNILDKPEIELKISYSNRAFKNGSITIALMGVQVGIPVLNVLLGNPFNISYQAFSIFYILIFIGILWYGLTTIISAYKGLKEDWSIEKMFGILLSLVFLVYLILIVFANLNDFANLISK